MTNLGSDNTPVKGSNFELPAGAQLDEDNGDLVIRDSGGNVVFRRDETNGEWVLDTVSADSLNTEEASIGTVSDKGQQFRLIDRQVFTSNITSQIQFSGLSANTEYRLFYSLRTGSNGDDVRLRLNGDGATSGNYAYWDATASYESGKNDFLIANSSSGAEITGFVMINEHVRDSTRQGITHSITTDALGRVSDFGREGGRSQQDNGLSSIEIIPDSTISGGGDPIFELWERDYS